MKKTFILVAMAFLLMGAVAVAEEAIIIDFALLNADIIADTNGKMTQNRRTVMDYGQVAGASYTDQQKALMRSSLAIEQWEVKLNSSSQNPLSVETSTVKESKVRDEGDKFAGQTLMGVRIMFPEWAHNANATIKPGFLIPAYEKMAQVDDQGNLQEATAEDKASGKSRFEEGYGVVRNTGVIKSIAVNTYGMNFPHGLYVLLRDQNNVVKRYFMGYLLFDGWREMVWNNPSYVSHVKARELRLYPVYPVSLPHVAFEGFLITRDAAHDGGDAIAYFKDVKVIYDKAVLTTVRDFADEDIWGIQTERDLKRKKIEVERFGQTQVLRFLEQEKLATEEGFTPSAGSEKQQ
ncbi:flagellar filament outer layer protein FlaA [Treponema putidum]|uniref:Flagellar filament outer layer protein n=1 Tax=Treponema putidum TaxID=221027 RepID=A0AAE9SIV7_9SPIR|nr:flagellar filament outer layer protein FlaA [Treponema putidum]AIN94491.1 flagellar protein [Treponema putidum]TWI78916.1 flagellar filament outer layer protein Flaa [Treponema putidum]UTY28495.1 flagellar protein [Treponema putidum]UTY30944.1 flagellar protein [Treponema putidum]UTY33361.1 flagellar protein [Treponema putidum]